MLRSLRICSLLLTLIAAQAFAQETFKHEQKIEALVEAYVKHDKVNAVSVGVLSNGETWTGHYGGLMKWISG